MNVAGCGYEWLVSPIILFTRTDRFLFLINWVSFLLLPGLVFCVLKYFGVRLRVAWWWSWALASGWCYVMQSASVSNDAFATVYALAAVALAMKARESNKNSDFNFSLLAAALLTGVKQTDIPLAALWAVAIMPQLKSVFMKQPSIFLITFATGLLISAVPNIFFNFEHTGTWAGLSTIQSEYPGWHITLDSPFWGIVGNAFCIPLQNVAPPFFPWNNEWNGLMRAFVETRFGSHFKSFEEFGTLSPGISESSAGIGLGIVLLTVISVYAAWKYRRTVSGAKNSLLKILPWILLLVFMAKVGEVHNARHLAPYYIFLFPLLLAGAGHDRLVMKIWWQRVVLFCMALSVGLLVIDINRPLFPVTTIMEQLSASNSQSKILSLLNGAYAAPNSLKIAERQIEENLPANEVAIGYASTGNAQLEPSLWLPFGSRRVERVLKQDTPKQLADQGIHYVVIENYPDADSEKIEDWLTAYHATLIANITFETKASENSLSHAYITRLETSE